MGEVYLARTYASPARRGMTTSPTFTRHRDAMTVSNHTEEVYRARVAHHQTAQRNVHIDNS